MMYCNAERGEMCHSYRQHTQKSLLKFGHAWFPRNTHGKGDRI